MNIFWLLLSAVRDIMFAIEATCQCEFWVFGQSCGRMRHRKADKLRDLTSRRCSLLRAVMLGGLDRLHARVPNVRGCQGLTPLRGRQSRPLTAPNIRKEAGQAIKAAPWPRRPQPADGARRFARKSGGSRSRNKAPIHRTLLASIHQNSPTRLHEDPILNRKGTIPSSTAAEIFHHSCLYVGT